MPDAVVTIVAGRHRHLLAQRRLLRRVAPAPAVHVVVALGDPEVARLLTDDRNPADPPTVLVEIPGDPDGLPLAAGRNAGARAAREAGADLLVFLDVDCLPAPDLPARYRDAAREHPDAVLSGPVTYLPPRSTPWTPRELRAARDPHPARPDPEPGACPPAEPDLFWSLNFALSADAWDRSGGFDEGYVGYGAEDTDFARRAVAAGLELRWAGGADAYHQHHPSSSPPLQHIDAILRNGRRFARRWGTWPMQGWLDAFAELGAVRRDGADWTRGRPVRLLSVPAHHPYVDAVRPKATEPVHPGRTTRAPDPMLSVATLARAAHETDVVHVHFGYEQVEPEALAAWADLLTRERIPLVVTVHDLRNPHLADNARHDQHLRTLLGAATEVVTLTDSVARELHHTYGVTAQVLEHPTLLADTSPVPDPDGPPAVAVPLGLLRRNVVDPAGLVRAVTPAAAAAGARVLVSARREATDDPRLTEVRHLVDGRDVELLVHDRFTDDELVAHVAAARVLVLPYRFGTHSGWLEIARDVGTPVLVPSGGHYRDQWDAAQVYACDETAGLQPDSLCRAVQHVLAVPRPAPAERSERLADRDRIRAAHEIVYRRALARS